MSFPTIPTTGNTRITGVHQANATATRTSADLSTVTHNAGDLMICIIVAYQSSGTANNVFSGWTAGWTEFIDQSTTGTMAIGAAYKWSTGSETGTVAATQAATVLGHAAIILMSIPAAHATTPPEATVIANGTSAAADPVALAPSWGAADTLWIAVGGSGEDATTGSWTTITTAPTNYGSTLAVSGTDVLNGAGAAVAFRQLNTSSENVGTWTVDLSNARNSALVIAVRPLTTAELSGTAAGAGTTSGTLTAPLARAVWLKADELSGADGSAVATWPDASGNARDLTQSVSGWRPIVVTNALNGMRIVRFDGVDDFVRCQFAATIAQSLTLFIVGRWRGAADGVLGQTMSNGWASTNEPAIGRPNYDGWVQAYAGGGALAEINVTQTDWRVYVAEFKGATSTLRGHDVAADTGDVGTNGLDGLRLGGNAALAQFGPVDVAEVILYAGGRTSGEITAEIDALVAKWLIGPAVLTGSATGGGTTSGAPTASPQLSGTAAGAGTTSATVTTSNSLVGTVTGAGTTVATLTASPQLTGSSDGAGSTTGTLDAPVVESHWAIVTWAQFEIPVAGGVAVLSGASAGSGSTTGALTATPKLSGTAAGTGATTGALTATPQFVGTSAGVGTTVGALTAQPQLTGTSAAAGTTTGALTASPQLSGATTGAGTTTGALLTAPQLAGTTVGAGTTIGALAATSQLSGVTTGAGTTSGVLAASPQLTGSIVGAGTTVGALTASPQLTGSTTGTGTTSGALTATAQLSGSTTGTGTTTGAVSVPGLATVSGTSAGTGTTTGALTASPLLSGTATGTGTTSGALSAAPQFVGTSTGAGTTTGAFTAQPQFTGTISGTGASTGALTASPQLSGATAGTGTTSGNLTVPGATLITGTTVGSGATTGVLLVAVQFVGTLTGSGATAGTLTASLQFSGTTTGTGTLTGTLSTPVAASIVATVTGSGSTTGALTVPIALTGTATAAGTLTGTLSILGPTLRLGVAHTGILEPFHQTGVIEYARLLIT